MSDICLEFNNFTLGYQGHAAVDHLSGNVQLCSLTAIAGANDPANRRCLGTNAKPG